MTSLERSIREWSEDLWPDRGMDSMFRKLCEEVGELGAALIENKSVKDIRGEIGDIGILLADLAGKIPDGLGEGEFTTLEFCMLEKFKEVRKRFYDKYGKRAKDRSQACH